MQIDNLYIENFKRFSKISIDFEPGVNLFVGENSSGKTTILEAVNVAMGGFFYFQDIKLQRNIKTNEIRLEKGVRVLYALVKANSIEDKIEWVRVKKRDKNNDEYLKPRIVIKTEGDVASMHFVKRLPLPVSNLDSIGTLGQQIFENFEFEKDSPQKLITPVIAYYSTQRLFSDARLSKKQNYDATNGRRNGYLQSLEVHAIKPVLDDWLGKAVTKRATKQIKDIFGVDNVLENVERAIIYVAKEFLGLNAVKIYQEPDFDNEVFLQFEKEEPLPISYYADGFRNLLYLVMDLMWRASQLNPWLTMKEIAEQVPGVVTIDEIDLHLHPRWQAKVIPVLQTLFPKVQFFITTHSPTVVANFDKGKNGGLYVVGKDGVIKTNALYFGKEVNTVLREVLGAPDRHKPTQDKINMLLDKITLSAPDDEIEALLNELIQQLGLEDVDVQRAKSIYYWSKIKDEDAVH